MKKSPCFQRCRRLILAVLVLLVLTLIDQYIGWRQGPRPVGDLRYYNWDTNTLWRLKPSISATVGSHVYHTNSAGFRGEEEYSIPSSHDFRILVLGDSRTYGMAVSDHETYSYRLQTELREMGLDVEVINAGTPGYTAVQCRAKLEQLLDYRPDVAVFAVGYNDRRYLLLTEPDSQETFRRTAQLREFMDVVHWSNTLFAISHRIQQRKLQSLRDDPPPLDTVSVRVPESVFREEIQRAISISRENGVNLFFLLIHQNPTVFAPVEEAAGIFRDGQYEEALDVLNQAEADLHVAAFAYCHYLQGVCYRALGREEKARGSFSKHRPLGSLHGEAILRSEGCYFQIIREVAAAENVPVLDSREAIANTNEYFGARFIDECHYDELGHALIGEALAQRLEELYFSPPTVDPVTDFPKQPSSQE